MVASFASSEPGMVAEALPSACHGRRWRLAGGRLTDAGDELLSAVESRTDSLAWQGGLASLGDAVDTAVEVLAPSLAALWDSGVLPAENPIGVPRA